MIVSNEPGYYKTGAYGIRIENLVAVKEAKIEGAERTYLGFETLTLAPIDLNCIDLGLLTDAGEGLAQRLSRPGARGRDAAGRRGDASVAGRGDAADLIMSRSSELAGIIAIGIDPRYARDDTEWEPGTSCAKQFRRALNGGRRPFRPTFEVAARPRSRGRDMPSVAKARVARQRQHLLAGVKKLMNGVPLARAPFSAMLIPGRSAASASSSGSRKVIANVEPGASAATSRSIAVIASRVRYMLTPVEATTAGRPASKPAAASCSPPGVARLEVDRHEIAASPERRSRARRGAGASTPGTGLIDLEHLQARGDLRPALGEGIEARRREGRTGRRRGRPVPRPDPR